MAPAVVSKIPAVASKIPAVASKIPAVASKIPAVAAGIRGLKDSPKRPRERLVIHEFIFEVLVPAFVEY